MNIREHFCKFKCFQRLTALAVYILIGAAIFVKLEQTEEPNEVVANRMLKAVQENLALQLGVTITDQQFWNAMDNITKALVIKGRQDWTYLKAVDFAAVALTTIGYGDITPRTAIGQGVFILYALFGLPLAMITLKTTGDVLHISVKKLIVAVEKKAFGKQEVGHLKKKCFIFSLCMFIILHGTCALLIQLLRGDSFFTGVYATFVTFSTIGFGDYRLYIGAGQAETYGRVKMIVLLVLLLLELLIGLTIVACFLGTCVDLLEEARNRSTVTNSGNPEEENSSNHANRVNDKSELPRPEI